MAYKLELEFAGKTDTGMVRSHNEDAIHISPEYGFVILADGMGGYNAGEIASSMAVEATRQVLETGLSQLSGRKRDQRLHQLVTEAIQQANTAVITAAHDNVQYDGMGTTIVAALFHGNKLTVAHVGDSRAYRIRQGELVQITRDHSLVQEQIDAGLVDPAWAPYAQNRNLVTRAVGVDPGMQVELHEHQMEEGDLYLICSDGLSDMLAANEFHEIIEKSGAELSSLCEALIQQANTNGGHDNISVILAKVGKLPRPKSGILGRLLNWKS
jgi:protein phosphatase